MEYFKMHVQTAISNSIYGFFFSPLQRISAKFNYFWSLLDLMSLGDELLSVPGHLKTMYHNQLFDKRKMVKR